jgi:hypothetical protein
MRALAVVSSLLVGCTPSAPLLASDLPSHAPAVQLLATMSGDYIDISGTVVGPLFIDLDAPTDDRDAFRYRVVDSQGASLYERTSNGPGIVREFLGFYSGQTGTDILAAFPKLGTFAVTVPLIDGGDRVEFELRGDDGVYHAAGGYDLAKVEADDVGVSPTVVDHATLHDAGPSENRLDIVIVGDGYTASEQDRWRADAAEFANALLDTPPFSDYPDYINVHRVDAISAESGASFDCVNDECRIRDTAFGTIFPIEVVNRLSGSDYNARAVFQLEQWEVARAVSVVPFDVVLVIANTRRYGGMAVHIATVTTPDDAARQDPWEDTGVHELAHILGVLGDEYVNDVCIRSAALGLPGNIADDPEAPPWRAWVDRDTPIPTPSSSDWADTVGAFAGAYNCPELYRPQRDCKMRNSAEDDFCAVCGEMLVRRFFRFADPEDAIVFNDGAVTVEAPRAGLPVEIEVGSRQLSGVTGEPITLPETGDVTVRVAMPAAEVLTDPHGDLASTTRFSR